MSSVCNGRLTQVSSLPLVVPPSEKVCKRFGCAFAGEDVATVIAEERGGRGDEFGNIRPVGQKMEFREPQLETGNTALTGFNGTRRSEKIGTHQKEFALFRGAEGSSAFKEKFNLSETNTICGIWAIWRNIA